MFEENRGQTDPAVRYLNRIAGGTLFFEDRRTRIGPLSITMPGANLRSPFVPEGLLDTQTDYLLGNDSRQWRRSIANYRSLRRSGIYPGIDLLYYSNPERLEYDFIVRPQANPALIKMHLAGSAPRIDAAGSLVAGSFIQRAPVAYQLDPRGRRRPVQARWRLDANTASFELGPYDQTRTLWIDPEIEAGIAIGGVGKDEWLGLVNTTWGRVAVGVTESLAYPNGYGKRGKDITLLTLSDTGVSRVVYLGGSGTDRPLAVTYQGSSPAIRIAGETDSRDFPIRPGFQPGQISYAGGASDGFVLDYTFNPQFSTGDPIVFSTYIGGSGADRVTAANGSLVAGETRSDDLPRYVAGSYTGGWDGFWASFSSGQQRGGYLGGSGDERIRAIATVNNLTLVGGSTTSSDLPTENAFQAKLNGPSDGFVFTAERSTFASIGTGLLPGLFPAVTSYWGGSGDDEITGLATTTAFRLVVSGNTSSTDLPLQNAAQNTYSGGESDAFLSRFDLAASTVVSSTYFGGSGKDAATHLLTFSDSVFLAGSTTSENLPVQGTGQSTYGGNTDAFVAEFRSTADADTPVVSAQYIGGPGTESVFGITLPIGFGQPGQTIPSVGVNSDSPEGPWRGTTGLNAPGNGDGFVLTLSEARIRLLNTELTIGKDHVLDAAVHLGGSVPLGPGIRVSITSADPSRVQVARFFTGPTVPSLEFTSLTRDFSFSIFAYADSGDVPVTIRAEGYPDQVVNVHLIPLRLFWVATGLGNAGNAVVGSVKIPLPVNGSAYTQRVFVAEGYVPNGGQSVVYPGRNRITPPVFFRFRSTNPDAVSAISQGINSVLLTRHGPGDADIIAETDGGVTGLAPLHVETADALPPVALTPALGRAPRGVLVSVPTGLRSRLRVRTENPERLKLVDPQTEMLVNEAEYLSNEIRYVGQTESGTTALTYIVDGKEYTGALVTSIAAQASLLMQNSPHRAATIARLPAQRTLTATFDDLWKVDSLVLEAVSSNPAVTAFAAPTRATWVRGSGQALAFNLNVLTSGTTELTLRVVDGPGFLKSTPLRLTVDELSLRVADTWLGKNLERTLTVGTGGGAAGSTVFTIESGDPAKLLVNGGPKGTATFDNRTGTFPFTIAALDESGVVPLTISAPGWPSTTSTVELARSAIAFARGQQLQGSPDVSLQEVRVITVDGITTYAALGSYALRADGEPIERQSPRSDLLAGTTLAVGISSDNPDVIAAEPTAYVGAFGGNANYTTKKTGTAKLRLEPPPGFSTPARGNELTLEVRKPGAFFGAVVIAKDTVQLVYFQQGSGRPTTWRISSPDPSRALLSTTETAAGVPTLNLDSATTSVFYIHALAGSGSLIFETVSPDYTVSVPLTVSFIKLDVVMTEIPSPFAIPLNGQPVQLVMAAYAGNNTRGTPVTLRPSVELRIPLEIADKSIAIVTPEAFVLRGNVPATVTVRPLRAGKTELRIAIPPDLAAPGQPTVIPLEVQGARITLDPTMVVGRDLMFATRAGFANSEGDGNLRVTIESTDPSRVLLSTAADQPGSARVAVTARTSQSIPFFVHALAASGDVVIRAQADGYGDATAHVLLRPSGLGLTLPYSEPVTIQGAIPFQGSVFTRIILNPSDSPSLSSARLLPRPGANFDFTIASTDANVVEVLTPKPVLTQSTQEVRFRGVRSGIADLKIIAASEIAVPAPVTVRVTGRQFFLNQTSYVIARQLQQPVRLGFNDVPATFTVTSSDPSRVILAPTGGVAGRASVTIANNASPLFFVQGVAEGSAFVTLSAPGFDDRRLTVQVGTPGLRWADSGTTILYTSGEPLSRAIVFTARLGSAEPVYGNLWPVGGLNIAFTSSNSSAVRQPAAIVVPPTGPPDTFSQPQLPVSLVPGGSAGQSIVSFTPPAGFEAAGPLTIRAELSAVTWSAATITIGKDTSRTVSPNLIGFANSSNIRFRFTSSDPSRLLIGTQFDSPGGATATGQGFSQIHLQALTNQGTATVTVAIEPINGPPFGAYEVRPLTVNLAASIWRFREPSPQGAVSTQYPLTLALYDVGTERFGLNYPLRPGITATINFTVSDPNVGSVRPNPLVVVGNSVSTPIFTAVKPGVVTITITPMAGFASDPELQTMRLTVQ